MMDPAYEGMTERDLYHEMHERKEDLRWPDDDVEAEFRRLEAEDCDHEPIDVTTVDSVDRETICARCGATI